MSFSQLCSEQNNGMPARSGRLIKSEKQQDKKKEDKAMMKTGELNSPRSGIRRLKRAARQITAR